MKAFDWFLLLVGSWCWITNFIAVLVVMDFRNRGFKTAALGSSVGRDFVIGLACFGLLVYRTCM